MATGRLPDPNSAPVTAKGDLYTYSTVPAKLAVGNNGETLVADSSATTGLRWQGNYSAGKNTIINGDFRIWQRGTSFASISSGTYSADRWTCGFDGTGVRTISQQTFTAGTAPVAGYEGTFFLRYNQTTAGTGGTYNGIAQRIEDVRTFAGQTVTLSFWAKADTTRTMSAGINQIFGSGGSATVYGATQNASLTTSWQRFSLTFSVASVSGKTIGTSSYLEVALNVPVNTTQTIDFWGVQLEAGNTATAFQTATGTLAGELSACQRYYEVGSLWREGTNANTLSYCVFSNSFLVQKRANATMTFGNVVDANANISSIDGPEAIYSSISPFSKNNLQTGFAFRFIPSATTSTIRQYWTASAEL